MGQIIYNGRNYSGLIQAIDPDCYSTEEREVGCWTDGKPLYQKTVTFTNLHARNTEVTLATGITDADELISISGTYRRTSDDTPSTSLYEPLPATHSNTAFNVSPNDFDTTTGDIVLVIGSLVGWFYVEDCQLTLQYTKTTDTAGSGKLNPFAIPTVHYSENEQVIGTWIDGSTLYQKTWDLGSDVTVGSWTSVVDVSGYNIDVLVNSISVQNSKAISQIEYWVDGTTLKGNSLRNNNQADYVRYLTIQYTKTS